MRRRPKKNGNGNNLNLLCFTCWFSVATALRRGRILTHLCMERIEPTLGVLPEREQARQLARFPLVPVTARRKRELLRYRRKQIRAVLCFLREWPSRHKHLPAVELLPYAQT